MPHQNRRPGRSLLLIAMSMVLVGAVSPTAPASAAPAETTRLRAQQDASTPTRAVAATTAAVPTTGKPAAYPDPVWPAAGAAQVDLTGTGSELSVAAARRVGTLPVTVRAASAGAADARVADADLRANTPARVRVEVLDRAAADRAGVSGLLLRVGRADGTDRAASVQLNVDYGQFRYAYGADWSNRLRLYSVPDCAGCPAVPLPSTNNTKTGAVTADVPVTLGGGLVALAAEPSGSTGDFSASPLLASSTWGVSTNSGTFTWSYPMRMPPGLDGPEPDIGLDYSSAGVDGKMAASNNQPSWIGEGFDLSGGAIERKYVACADDMGDTATNKTKTGDLCWKTDNAVLSLGGSATELVKAADGTWRGRTDDATRAELKVGAVNGDEDGQHWVVTKPDGTQFWFGRNRLPGWVTGKPVTNSTWVAPVFGNNPNEPCYKSTFSTAHCDRAWRWNLDYVVDPFGNTMSYWYGKETNKYARAASATTLATYTRGGWLDRIDYGTRSDTSYGTAPMQVDFAEDNRCLTTSCGTHNATNWPDTPWDQECTASPCLVGSPTFWSTKRLKSVTTKVRSGSAYRSVETWTLVHGFPDPGDGTRAGLWLERIQHTGGTESVPDVVLSGVQKPNRVDATDKAPAMNWWRLSTVTTETGGSINVTYSGEDCVRETRMPAAPESNTLRCYPVRWTPSGAAAPITDYFHKYVVLTVAESDLALPSDARSPRTLTSYEYLDDPAWHYADDDGLVKEKDRTWSQWRGYGRVRVLTGEGAERERTERVYFRGMNGDKLPTGTREVTMPAAGGAAAVADDNEFAGMLREEIDYAAPTGNEEIVGTVNTPWRSAPTATRTLAGVTVTARHTGIAETRDRTALDGGRGFRTSTQRTTYDEYGMEAKEEDLGDDAVTGDETCTVTTYARNTTAWLVEYASRVQEWAVDCTKAAGTGLTQDDLVSDDYTSYDGQARGAAPKKGAVTRSEELKTWPGTYLTNGRATYDDYGRVVESWDVRDNRTATTYVPAAGGPLTGTISNYRDGWAVTTTTIDPAFGVVTREIDPNGRRTDRTYDGLGRATAAWEANRDKDAGESANLLFTYEVRNNAPSVTTTSTLNVQGTGYVKSYAFADSLGRTRQTQQPEGGTQGGRLVTDTAYDTAGRVTGSIGPFVVDGPPSTTMVLPLADAQVPAQTRTEYDTAGRSVATALYVKGIKKWETRTIHGGDRTDTIPPAGSAPSSSYVDVKGHVVLLREFTGPLGGAGRTDTTYRYNRKDQLVEVKDTVGNTWTFGYDLRGRPTSSSSPDSGTSTKVLNDAGDVLTTTDSRGRTLAYSYDALGRRTATRDGSSTGPLRAEWTYDTLASGTVVRGQQVRSIRHEGSAQYVSETLGFTDLYQPTGQTITIPSTETGLGGTYTYVNGYTPNGLPLSSRMPELGGQPQETITTGYDGYGRPITLTTDVSSTGTETTIVNGTSYTRYGEVAVVGLRTDGGKWLDTANSYEEGTRRLSRLLTTRETSPSAVLDQNFSYDPAGNILRLREAVAGDTQCFAYDGLRRLTEAWTPGSGDCAAARSQAALGGPAPYWESFGYDATGNRTSATKRTKTSSASWTNVFPAPGAAQPHTLRSTTVTGSVTASASYSYDQMGNTLTRPTDGMVGAGQTITWNVEGELESSTDATGRTQYVYDADGNRLVRRDPTGSTLYLPGQELRHTKADGVKSGTRFYSHAGRTVAVRNSRGLTWQVADHQGSVLASVTTADQVVTQRRQTPFGESRGPAPAWNTDKGFVGGTNDNTNLVHLSAREYDPVTGRFISADAIVDHDNTQQMNGYAYANNSPVTMSDPDGNMLIGDDRGRIRAIPVYGHKRKHRVIYPKRRFVGPVYRPRKKQKPPFVGPVRKYNVHTKTSGPKRKSTADLGPSSCAVNPAWCYRRPPTVRDCKSNPYNCYQRPPTVNKRCEGVFFSSPFECRNPPIRSSPSKPAPPKAKYKHPPSSPGTSHPYDQWALDFCFVACVGLSNSQKSDGKYQTQFQVGLLGCCGPGVGWSHASVGAEKQGRTTQLCGGVAVGGCLMGGTTDEDEVWEAQGISFGAGKSLGGFLGSSWSFCFKGCDPGEGISKSWPKDGDLGGWGDWHNPFG